jgi:predicted nucleic acid-binding protein
VLAMFHNQGELFQPDVSGPVSSDPADTKFLHCAQAAQADYIVTGNVSSYPLTVNRMSVGRRKT